MMEKKRCAVLDGAIEAMAQRVGVWPALASASNSARHRRSPQYGYVHRCINAVDAGERGCGVGSWWLQRPGHLPTTSRIGTSDNVARKICGNIRRLVAKSKPKVAADGNAASTGCRCSVNDGAVYRREFKTGGVGLDRAGSPGYQPFQ